MPRSARTATRKPQSERQRYLGGPAHQAYRPSKEHMECLMGTSQKMS